MSRPKKCRMVCSLPKYTEFSPGVEESVVKDVIIMTVDEYESIRLIDYEGFSQEECSEYMKVARTTAQQIYNSARKKMALALVDGHKLKIEGGDYQICDKHDVFCACRRRGCISIIKNT